MSTEQTSPGDTPLTEPRPVGAITINDEAPLNTAAFREHPVFKVGDPKGQVPDVILGSAPLNRRDRAHRNEQRVGINHDGERAGAFNLSQLTSGTTWLRDVNVERDKRGRRLALAAYLGVIAAAHNVGRRVQSDPAGLSPARRVWESLVRRGVAEVVEGQDQHGNPRFISKLLE